MSKDDSTKEIVQPRKGKGEIEKRENEDNTKPVEKGMLRRRTARLYIDNTKLNPGSSEVPALVSRDLSYFTHYQELNHTKPQALQTLELLRAHWQPCPSDQTNL